MSWLRSLPTRRKNAFQGGHPAPDQSFYAIGDVHGRLDLLEPLLTQLKPDYDPIVLVGDYVDRGQDSAGVLALLHDMSASDQIICLRGNHEELLLKFIDMPAKHGQHWLRLGGLQTLASYGIGGVTELSPADDMARARDALVAAMGDQLAWLRQLPYFWQSGNVAVVHAGADPALPLNKQVPKSLAWGHKHFQKRAHNDGLWIIYGHVIVPDVQINNRCVAIDTGAYATGRLTSVRVADGAIAVV